MPQFTGATLPSSAQLQAQKQKNDAVGAQWAQMMEGGANEPMNMKTSVGAKASFAELLALLPNAYHRAFSTDGEEFPSFAIDRVGAYQDGSSSFLDVVRKIASNIVDAVLAQSYNIAANSSSNVSDILSRLDSACAKSGGNYNKQQSVDAAKTNLTNVLANVIAGHYTNLSNGSGGDAVANYTSNLAAYNGDLKNAIAQAITGGLVAPLSQGFDIAHTTLENNYAKQIWDEIYRNWDSLNEDVKNFYNMYVSVQQKVGSEWRDVSNYAGVAGDVGARPSEFRLNLKKSGDGTTLFSKSVPELPIGSFGRVWFTDAQGTVQSLVNITDKDFLRKLYDAVYMSTSTDITVGGTGMKVFDKYDVSHSLQYFHVDVDKIVRARLNYIREQPLAELPVPEDVTEVYDFVTKNTWKRNGSGKLVTSVNGQEVAYDDINNPKLKASYNCYSSMLYPGNQEGCNKYMLECLSNNDPAGLKECLKHLESADFDKVVKEEINNMQPIIALRTLQKFGFRVTDAYDSEMRMQVKKVETVQHWLENYMKSKFGDNETSKTIVDNQSLLRYLTLIVQFVNANPAILNKGVGSVSDESVGNVQTPSYADKLKIRRRIDPALSTKPNGAYDMSVLRGYNATNLYGATLKKPLLGLTPNGVLRSYDAQYHQFSFNPVFSGVAMQQGGGASDTFLKRVKSGSVVASGYIQSLFEVALRQMKQHNKQLDDSNQKDITAKIAKLGELETDLIKQLKYIETYNECIDGMSDYNSKSLDMKELEKLVSNCNSLYQKHGTQEQSLMKILHALQKISCGQSGPEISEVDAGSYKQIDTRNLL
jgi:hypothetical protein